MCYIFILSLQPEVLWHWKSRKRGFSPDFCFYHFILKEISQTTKISQRKATHSNYPEANQLVTHHETHKLKHRLYWWGVTSTTLYIVMALSFPSMISSCLNSILSPKYITFNQSILAHKILCHVHVSRASSIWSEWLHFETNKQEHVNI